MKTKLNIITFQLILSLLLPVICFSQVHFSEQIIIQEPDALKPKIVSCTDVDRDGDMDIICCSSRDGKISWYENLDANGTFGSQNIIASALSQVSIMETADFDSDGDKDILTYYNYNRISWFENVNDGECFEPENVVTDTASYLEYIVTDDFDSDGDVDFIATGNAKDKIILFQNMDGKGNFGEAHAIKMLEYGDKLIQSWDMDADGDKDIVFTSERDSIIAWLENTGGKDTFGNEHVIDNIFAYRKDVPIAVMDGDSDGDLDIFAAFYDDIVWYENTDGKGSFGNRKALFESENPLRLIIPADVDGNGDMDLLYMTDRATNDNDLGWYQNIHGNGRFSSERVIDTTYHRVNKLYASDLDNDDDLDIVSLSILGNSIAWYENVDGQGVFGTRQEITTSTSEPRSIYAADLDNDGDKDVLYASHFDHKITWHENVDGKGSFGIQQIISDSAIGAIFVCAADLDRDNDEDVISASLWDGKIAWYENDQAVFKTEHVITNSLGGARCAIACDLDGDGDFDILAAGNSSPNIVWYENTDGKGTFGPENPVAENLTIGHIHVSPADLDNDGDIDILYGTDLKRIGWLRNEPDGFIQQPLIAYISTQLNHFYPADLDGDGAIDVLAATWRESVWYKNVDGQGTFGEMQTITATRMPQYVFPSDLDMDGDLDVITSSKRDDIIVWSENTNGLGQFAPHQVVWTLDSDSEPYCIYATDIDGDEDNDIISTTLNDSKIAWYRNSLITHVKEPKVVKIPGEFQLLQNYPNPFNAHTQIVYSLSKQVKVKLIVYNYLGQEIVTLVDQVKPAGTYTVCFDASQINSGVYIYKLVTGSDIVSRKMLYLK